MQTKTVIVYQRQLKAKKDICQDRVLTNNRGRRRKLGFLLLTLSLTGFLFFLSPYLAGRQAQEKAQGFAPIMEQKLTPSHAQETVLQAAEPESKPKVENFLLTIDKIDLAGIPVIPEVDANNADLYKEALNHGLVHAQGSGLPGEGRLIYIFGHSANYPWVTPQFNAWFFKLDQVEVGDKIKVEYNGQHFLYHIFDKKIVAPNELEAIKNSINEDILVLQSCWPVGTTLQRLLLFGRPSKLGALIY